MKVVYKYFAVKPIRAAAPDGGVVTYEPGQEVPASDWGRAADNLVEMGKIARVAFNVDDDAEIEVELGPAAVEIGASHVTPPKRGRPRKS